MKQYIRCSNELSEWLRSIEVEDLMHDMYAREKRMVGKIANAGVIESYVLGVVDSIDLFRSEVSPAFDAFLSGLMERI